MGYDIDRRTKLAKQLKAARQRAALSAKQAAEKLTSLGVVCSRGTLLAWERGGERTSREPFASDLSVLAQAYSCSVDAFFDDTPASAPGAGSKVPPHVAHNSPGANDRDGHQPATF